MPPALVNESTNSSDGDAITNNPNNHSLLHPQHVQRTEELRAQAAAVREQQALNSQEESFPTLQSGAAPTSSSAPLVGWASGTSLQQRMRPNRNVGQVSQEAFPTLPTASVSNQNKKRNAIRGQIGATRRQFAAMTTSANNPQQQQATWGAPSPSTNAFASASRQMNRQADLARENFPTLGRPSSSVASSSTNTLARQTFQQRAFGSTPPPSMNSASDFPSMTSSASVARASKKNLKPPPLNSASDFPAPPSAKPPAKSTLRQQMLGESDRKMPSQDNFLQANMTTTASAKATIEDMKASMGQKNFKQLKTLTKTFAQEQLAPEGYVDQATALFDKGYDDPDFWAFLPSLLQSCPNQGSAQHALKYMNSLKRQQTQTSDRKPAASTKAAASKWGGSSANASNVMRQVAPPPLPAAFAAPRSVAQPPRSAAPRSLTQPVAGAMRPQTMASKKNSAWGAGGKSTVVRTKAAPGSVGAAAASQGPQGGSATKFMAKQQKKQKQAAKNGGSNNSNQQQSKAKKKKQKNELRELAFGK